MHNEIAITKAENNIETAVKEAIDLVGGLESLVNMGDKVYLKPNFVAPRDSSKGVTTHLEIIRAVAEEVRRCGGIPILFETPAIEFEMKTVYDILGVPEFARKNNIGLIDDSIELIKVQVPGGIVLNSITIPRILHNAKIINLPKLKTHVSAKMTCGMKNLIGLLPNSQKRRVHIRGVHASIADICRVIHPILTLVDAITCMEADGPTYGDPIELGLIITGKDMISVDKVCSQIIGLPWREIKYIRLVDAQTKKGDVKLLGMPLGDIKAHFKLPEKGALFHLCFRLMYVFDVVFSKFFPLPFNRFLYSTGFVGTNPMIVREKCVGCGDCIVACPIEGAIQIENHKVDYKSCIRCLNCYDACSYQAIAVKGISRPGEPR